MATCSAMTSSPHSTSWIIAARAYHRAFSRPSCCCRRPIASRTKKRRRALPSTCAGRARWGSPSKSARPFGQSLRRQGGLRDRPGRLNMHLPGRADRHDGGDAEECQRSVSFAPDRKLRQTGRATSTLRGTGQGALSGAAGGARGDWIAFLPAHSPRCSRCWSFSGHPSPMRSTSSPPVSQNAGFSSEFLEQRWVAPTLRF